MKTYAIIRDAVEWDAFYADVSYCRNFTEIIPAETDISTLRIPAKESGKRIDSSDIMAI